MKKVLFLIVLLALCRGGAIAQNCETGTVTALANTNADSVAVCNSSGVQLQLQTPDAADCSGNWEYLWFDGNNYFDGSGFNAANEVWHTAYNSLVLSSATQTTTYKAKMRCSTDYTCTDSSVVKLIVNPVPVCSQKADIEVCCGGLVNIGDFVGNPTGTTFTWTNTNVSIGLASSGTGNILSFSANANCIGSNIVGTITSTPSLNGCAGTPMSFTVTILPAPSAPVSGGNQQVCFGSPVPNLTATGTGTVKWYTDATLTSLVYTGPSFPSGQTGIGSYTYYVTQTVNGCESPATTVTLTINPLPQAGQLNNIAVCPGSQINVGIFASIPSGATYTWTNSNTNIGIAANGSGNIPPWTAPANSTGANIVGTITVTPSRNGCTGANMIFTVIIYATPTVNQKSNIAVCPGAQINIGNFVSVPSGASFTWTNSNTNIGLAASGIGNIPSWIAPVNNTCTNITSTITVNPTLNGCPGYPMSFTVTVYPTPQVSLIPDVFVCPEQEINIGSLNGCPLLNSYQCFSTNADLGYPFLSCSTAWIAPPNNTGSNITGDIIFNVTSEMGCYFSISSSVTIYPEPGTPPLVIGPATSNEGTTNTYTVNAVPGATSYIWTVPTGWTIVSGQGTNSISAITGQAGQNGDITVSAVNLCDTSAASTMPATSVSGMMSLISGVINQYYKVTEFYFCDNAVTLISCSGLSVGDKVLLIQMKGAVIDSSNTISSGSITDYKNAGNYDIAVIDSISGCKVFLRDSLMNSYTPEAFVQLVKIPQYNNVTITDTLTCLKWNGSTGGVLIFEAQGSITLNAPVDVSGKGFSGGAPFTCDADFQNTSPLYVMPSYSGNKVKGEGISGLSAHLIGGRGTLANGGGAAGAQPALNGLTDALFNGGGGGGNYGAGGNGGKSSTFYPTQYPGGLGGRALSYSNMAHKIFMGGGGGAGHRKYATTGPTNGTDGGGIVIVKADSLTGNNAFIRADGIDNQGVLNNTGRGGGGAGGTILLDVQNYSGTLNMSVKGGHGGDNAGSYKTGPGGGGGGGVVWVKQSNLPSPITCNVNGGTGGLQMTYTDPWGASDGAQGATLYSLVLPIGQNIFVPFTTTTTIASNSPVCEGDTLLLTADLVSGIDSFLWVGPNGFVSHLQNPQIPNVNSSNAGVYTLYLIDNCCAGSPTNLTATINPKPAPPITSDTACCFGQPTPDLTATGSGTIQWYICPPSSLLVHTGNVFPPSVIIPGVYSYCVAATENQCQSDFAQATLTIHALPLSSFNLSGNDTICPGSTSAEIQLSSSQLGVYYQLYQNSVPYGPPLSGTGNMLEWQALPAGIYTVEATYDNSTCSLVMPDTITVTEWPPLQVYAGPDQISIYWGIAQLNASVTGGSGSYLYQWEPASLVADPNADSTSTIPLTMSQQFVFFATDSISQCTYSDTMIVYLTCIPLSVTATAQPILICAGDTVQLNAVASGGSGTYSYTWTSVPQGFTSAAQNPVAMPNVSTTYTVVVNDLYSIGSVTASVVVTVSSSLIQYSISADVYCLDSTNTNAIITLNGSENGVLYQLYKNDSAYGLALSGTGNALTWGFLTNGSYYVEGYDPSILPCTNYFSNTLIIGETPLVTLGNDTTVCDINTLLLSGPPGNGYTYTWLRLPDDTIGNGLYQHLDYTTSGLGLYYYVLLVSDTNNCTASDTIGVNFQVCPSVPEYGGFHPEIYPNPAQTHIFIKAASLPIDSITVINTLGMTVYNGPFVSPFDISQLPQGLYIMGIEYGKQMFYTKFLKTGY